AVRAEQGTAPFGLVSIDDAIGDLPRFDWCAVAVLRARERVTTLPCDPEKPHVGIGGTARYHHAPRTTFQVWCRQRPTADLQHITQVLPEATVKRVISIPMRAGADYRALNREDWEWQFSDPASAIARKGFRPGLYGRLDKDYVFQTTVTNVRPTAKQCRILSPYCHRILTVRELARSQGFPDWFIFYSLDDKVTMMHRQVGNAVPWPVAAAIGRELREVRLEKWRSDRREAMLVE
ncbi:S-adenosyl-L-methionine-dependent methyltransferase, partial [Gloeopeniophorella convolvens]